MSSNALLANQSDYSFFWNSSLKDII